MLRTVVILDYQNVHMTAHDVFGGTDDLHRSLIHPVQFAKAGILRRNERTREGYPHAELSSVMVYRGLHHVDYNWEQNRRCLDQATHWRKDGAVVELRDLKYKFKYGAGGPVLDVHGKRTPDGRPQEKGIDVLCALACVRHAVRPDIDLVVLASRDTDLVPALDEVHDLHREAPSRNARIETFSWFSQGEGRRSFGQLRPSGGRRIWNTNLDQSCYEASLDRKDYR